MKFPVRVSIVIPHLNEPDDLRRCLAALDAQREDGAPVFEVIVADNGSTPLPHDVIAEYPSVRMTIEPRPGPGPARNLGVTASTGDIIAFVDADCIVQPGWLRRIVAVFDDHADIDFVGGSVGIAPAVPGRMTAIEAYEAIFSYRVRLFVERDRFAATGNMAVRRSVFEAVGPFDGIGTHEDRRWGHRARDRGYRIGYLPEARVLTPACGSPADMRKRIDRHVAHCVSDLPEGTLARLKWLLLAGAMFVSPLAGIPVILQSEDVPGTADRLRAFACLVRVRFYRGWRMVTGLRRKVVAETIASWNRNTIQAGRKEG